MGYWFGAIGGNIEVKGNELKLVNFLQNIVNYSPVSDVPKTFDAVGTFQMFFDQKFSHIFQELRTLLDILEGLRTIAFGCNYMNLMTKVKRKQNDIATKSKKLI